MPQATFGWNTCFLKLFSTIKMDIVTAKTMQSAYSCAIFHVSYKKITFLAVLTWFLVLGKIQDSGQDGENIPHLVKKIKDFPLKGKSFRNPATYQELRGGAPSTHPSSPPLYYGGGIILQFCVYVRGLNLIITDGNPSSQCTDVDST